MRQALLLSVVVGRWVVDFLRSTYNQATEERHYGERDKEKEEERQRESTDSYRPRPIPGLRRRTAPESGGEPTGGSTSRRRSLLEGIFRMEVLPLDTPFLFEENTLSR